MMAQRDTLVLPPALWVVLELVSHNLLVIWLQTVEPHGWAACIQPLGELEKRAVASASWDYDSGMEARLSQ